MMNKEVYHEGWLTKSPPTKRIWRARWRRRWFTLKQGELPGQFFLEYYTDRKCRKLKGTIDLDQCEQVDAGLRLDRQKHKFAHMFDVKTPRRTYYLAADSEDDMRGWVNCICQVCNLQETKTAAPADDRQYYNIGPDAINSAPIENDLSNETETTLLTNNSIVINDQQISSSSSSTSSTTAHKNSISGPTANQNSTYQNEEMLANYSNRETIVCEGKLNSNVMVLNKNEHFEAYSNFSTIERSQSLRGKPESSMVCHNRTQSLNDQKSGGAVKKIPENLKLTDKVSNFVDNNGEQPSPALSTCSGPYIPISECFSGSPVLLFDQHTPNTPLNSLDPRFYDTPRSHTNIGFNLTNNEQPYSPKRNNYFVQQQQNQKPRSGKSTPSDSESVFTDDEWSHPVMPQNTLDRSTRPSDSSIENDAIGWTYVQRFAKISDDKNDESKNGAYENSGDGVVAPPRPPKRTSLILDGIEKTKDTQSSDTENASPAIGPKDCSSYVEQCYDIPRSHRFPYCGSNNNLMADSDSIMPINHCDLVASSTPNLISEIGSQGTLGRQRPHCYTNAAPTKIEGNVFRYDFIEQDAPIINRSLKPKSSADITRSIESVGQIIKQVSLGGTATTPIKIPPCVDRKLKPSTPKFGTNSMRRKGGPVSLQLPEHEYGNCQENQSFGHQQFSGISPRTPSKSEDRLQYLDLDHSSSPQKSNSNGPGSLSVTNLAGNHSNSNQLNTNPTSKFGMSSGALNRKDLPGVAYTTVDFVKTDALNRVREDSELTRAKSRLKD